MSLVLPPVGVHSTAEQLLQTTTLWEWLNTVVLHSTSALYQPKRHITCQHRYYHDIGQAPKLLQCHETRSIAARL